MVQFGFRSWVTREVARDESRAPRMMGEIIALQSILAIVGFTAMAIVLKIIAPGQLKTQLTYIVGLSTVLESFQLHFNAYFRGRQIIKYEAIVRFFFSAVRSMLIVGVMFLGYGILAYVVSELVAHVASLVLCFTFLQLRIARPSSAFNPRAWAAGLRAALPFAMMSGLIVLYVRGDTILLSLMRGDEMTGWYSAATRFFTLFAFVPRSIMGAVLPVMALQSIQLDSTKALSKSYSRSFRFLFITGLPLALGMGLLAEPIVGLLYGDQFLEAVPAMQILMLALMASFVNFAGTHALVSLNRERAVLGISAASLAINFALNLLLIPFLGHIGAAITSVVSEGLVLVLQLRLLNQELEHTAIVRGLAKPLIAGLAMAGFLLAFRDISVVALIVPAGVIYLGILLLLRAFHADEVQVFRTLLPQGLKWLPLGRGADNE